jgi:hypothetical protein
MNPIPSIGPDDGKEQADADKAAQAPAEAFQVPSPSLQGHERIDDCGH